MEILPKMLTTKNSPEQFAGDVWLDPIATPQDGDQRMTVATVRFAPGARTPLALARARPVPARHRPRRAVRTRDGQIIEVHPGQPIYTPPGKEQLPWILFPGRGSFRVPLEYGPGAGARVSGR